MQRVYWTPQRKHLGGEHHGKKIWIPFHVGKKRDDWNLPVKIRMIKRLPFSDIEQRYNSVVTPRESIMHKRNDCHTTSHSKERKSFSWLMTTFTIKENYWLLNRYNSIPFLVPNKHKKAHSRPNNRTTHTPWTYYKDSTPTVEIKKSAFSLFYPLTFPN